MQSKTLFFSPTCKDVKCYESTAPWNPSYSILTSAQFKSNDSPKIVWGTKLKQEWFFLFLWKAHIKHLSHKSNSYVNYEEGPPWRQSTQKHKINNKIKHTSFWSSANSLPFVLKFCLNNCLSLDAHRTEPEMRIHKIPIIVKWMKLKCTKIPLNLPIIN